MLCILAASAALACGTVPHLGHPEGRDLATLPLYPPAMADDAHRPGFNGEIFRTRPILGPGHGPYAEYSCGPGADYYGAWGAEDQRVYVLVGHQVVSFSPWGRIPQEGLQSLERARNQWLKERGYVGGVRTFVNDRYVSQQVAGLPRPRATIFVPDEMRPRERFQVNAGDRVSLPPNAPRDLAARLRDATIARAD